MFDIPLLIISVLVLGAKLGARTIVAALFTPLAMNVLSLLSILLKKRSISWTLHSCWVAV